MFDVIEALGRLEHRLIKEHEANTAKFYNRFSIDIEADLLEQEPIKMIDNAQNGKNGV